MAQRRVSARTYMLGLIAVAAIPVWAFAAYLLVSLALSQQQTYRDQATQLARQSAAALDSELDGISTMLDILALSVDAEAPDLDGLAAKAMRIVAGTPVTISLHRGDGTPYPTTDDGNGTAPVPLPPLTPREVVDLESGSALSDVHKDTRTGSPTVTLYRRLSAGGEDLLLAATVPTSMLWSVLRNATPEGWIIGVADRAGTYVTRSERHDDVSGQPGVAEYIAKAEGTAGTFTAANQFGDVLLAGYYRSPRTGWLHAANIELQVVEAPLRQSLKGIAGIGLLALAVSLLLAYFVGRRLTDETRKLVKGALAVGSRHPLQAFETPLAEYALVGDALVKADQMLMERTSQLEAVVSTAPVAVWFTYDPSGRAVIRNRFAAELMGLPADDGTHFGVVDQVVDTIAIKDGVKIEREDRPLTRAMRGESTDNAEYAYILPSGSKRILVTSARPIRGCDGAIIGAVQVSMDITERKKGEEERRLLANELNHRVKNNLAIVQSLAKQTMRNATSLVQAETVLSARLGALAQAHDVLTRNAWTGGSLRDVIARSVLSQTPPERIDVDGDDLQIGQELVMTITLACHELTTNAIKYGALSGATGRVRISWPKPGSSGRFVMTWTESDGPPVAAPTERGFGTRLLERLAAAQGGSLTLTFGAGGLEAVLDLPLEHKAAGETAMETAATEPA